MRAAHPLTRHPTTGHQAFTGIVWLVAQLGAEPATFDLGTVAAGDAVHEQRQLLARWFTHASRSSTMPGTIAFA